jgi:DNA-binding IclR family transcriptional regulator
VFDAVGELALAIVALGQEGTFDIAWGGEIDTALRACAQKLSYELGYSPDARDA